MKDVLACFAQCALCLLETFFKYMLHIKHQQSLLQQLGRKERNTLEFVPLMVLARWLAH